MNEILSKDIIINITALKKEDHSKAGVYYSVIFYFLQTIQYTDDFSLG